MVRCCTVSLLASLALSACVREAPVDARFRTVAQADAGRGPRLMAQYQCGSCHVVPGAPAAATAIAVPLTRFGQRSYIAGRLPNGPATLPLWLLDPPAQVPGTAMPRLGLSPQDARDIAAYLLSAE